MGTIATTATITVDLQQPKINTIHAKQFDSLSRYADIKLLSGGQPWAVESSITYVIQYEKPDGTKGMYDKLPDGTTDAVTAETDVSGCTVLRARFAPQMFTVAGRVRFSVAMVQTDGTKLQTFSAILDVEPSEVNSYTSEDYYKVTSLDELLEEVKKRVKSVNQILPNTNGDVYIRAESIDAQVPSLDYQGSVEGALEALATMTAALPVARASSADGIAYTATGDGLPTVSVADNMSQISAVGKGRQIVFVPMEKNQSTMPTLRINGGEVIPIRMRAPRNYGDNDDIPDATQHIWIGALMRGVPYTMTFCGKYWLLDSMPFVGRVDKTAAYTGWTPEDGTAKTVANYAKTLADGSYRIADATIGRYEIDVFTVVNGQQWRSIRDYDDEFCYYSVFCGEILSIYVDSETGYVQVGGRTMLTNDNIPLPTAADIGKVLTATAANRAVWMSVVNAEEVAV